MTPQKLAALRLVAEGRVKYGDPYPERSRRMARVGGGRVNTTRDIGGRMTTRAMPTHPRHYALNVFTVDGAQVYGGEHRTYAALVAGGLADHGPGDGWPSVPIVLTDAGRAALRR